jgi:hypothetical protein
MTKLKATHKSNRHDDLDSLSTFKPKPPKAHPGLSHEVELKRAEAKAYYQAAYFVRKAFADLMKHPRQHSSIDNVNAVVEKLLDEAEAITNSIPSA